MLALWSFYWPVFPVGIIAGLACGLLAFLPHSRQQADTVRKRRLAMVATAVATAAFAALWHGPVGTAERLVSAIETGSRTTLVDFEMAGVTAKVERAPVRRTLLLSGTADQFQRGELVRILNEIPGVGQVRWTGRRSGFSVPLLAEVELLAFLGFTLGLLLSYLVELRRRARADWRW